MFLPASFQPEMEYSSISDESNSEMPSREENLTRSIMEEYGFGYLSQCDEPSVRDDVETSEGYYKNRDVDFISFSALSKNKLKRMHSKIVSKLEEIRMLNHSSREEQLVVDMMKGYGFGDVIKEGSKRSITVVQNNSTKYLPKKETEKASRSLDRKVTFGKNERQYIDERK